VNEKNNEHEIKHSTVMKLIDIVQYQSGSIVSKVLSEKKTGTVTLFSFSKGESLSKHSAPFDAIVNILDGEAEIIIDEKSNSMKAGDIIIMPADIPHAVKAKTNFKMILTMIKS
jgi:quercetin dioxygenase-like cupin family protein